MRFGQVLREVSTVSRALLHYARNPKILYWLAQELEKQIPDFDPNGQDRRLLAFAYQDLETCLGVRWKVANSHELRMMVTEAVKNRWEELKAFLKIWTGQWLEKWRERVSLFQNKPKFSKRYLESVRKAKKMYAEMEKRQELKRLIVQKLVNQGEVCMAELIAESLIIEEIAHQLNNNSRKASMKKNMLNRSRPFKESYPE
jgi:hypothetical protein